jgi:3-oxoacyl-[acyl-carrier-protein] synthase II
MHVLGAGVISAAGQGISAFSAALQDGWKAPSPYSTPAGAGHAYQVDLKAIADRSLLKKMRRADRLSKMAVVAAAEAFNSSGLEHLETRKIGVITATALGAHATTFGFLSDILEYGDGSVSPTTFSNSVHNAAASYISSVLGITGPTLTVTQFFFSFHGAIQLARAWLREGRCDLVLAGAVEQCGDELAYIQNRKSPAARDGKIRPFHFSHSGQVPGEGAVFLLLSREDERNAWCTIEATVSGDTGKQDRAEDLIIIDADGLLPDESMYRKALAPDVPAAAYAPLFGSMMSGSAFNCLAGIVSVRNQRMFAVPVQDNPHGVNIITETGSREIELVRTIRYNCYGRKAGIVLTRS